MTSGNALVYIVRKPHFAAEYAENNLYVDRGDGGGPHFFGATIANTYCPLDTPVGTITISVETDPKSKGLLTKATGGSLTLTVAAGREYFVWLDFDVGFVAGSTSTLRPVDEKTGREMLAHVQGKCFAKPYSERRLEVQETR